MANGLGRTATHDLTRIGLTLAPPPRRVRRFFAMLVLGVIAFLLVLTSVPESRDESVPRHLDLPGVVTVSLGVAAVIVHAHAHVPDTTRRRMERVRLRGRSMARASVASAHLRCARRRQRVH